MPEILNNGLSGNATPIIGTKLVKKSETSTCLYFKNQHRATIETVTSSQNQPAPPTVRVTTLIQGYSASFTIFHNVITEILPNFAPYCKLNPINSTNHPHHKNVKKESNSQ